MVGKGLKRVEVSRYEFDAPAQPGWPLLFHYKVCEVLGAHATQHDYPYRITEGQPSQYISPSLPCQ